ncbi:DNA polymerase III subunit delta [Pararhizobium haloflavum]|uniref:DNA polymerase III subunit delta n=1 Tax=Pararhizobium haloflavum TaxID=2037914 RepID=UPI000C176526|nr:DNA polymerase III subunit delta [Pararhizobium haloflavum]
MSQIKAHEFEGLYAKKPPAQPIVLIYGPDRGLVSERAEIVARTSGVALDDGFSLVRMDASALQGDPGRLIDEARSIGLFGGHRLVWLKGAGNGDRALIEAVTQLNSAPPVDCTILIEAGDLKKGTGLRKAVEESRSALAVPCYADEGRAVNGLIDEEMAAAGLRMTSGARQLLLDLVGGDRLATRAELRKLALYCMDREVVSEEDVLSIVGDAASLTVDAAVDAVLLGDVPGLETALQRIIASKTPVFLALQSVMRQFQMLDQFRSLIESEGKTQAGIMQANGRRIHFKRKPAIEKALATWRGRETAQALDHLQTAILESRRQAGLADSISRQALLALAVRSARRARVL